MTLELHLTETTTAEPRTLTPSQVATLTTVPELITLTPAGSRWRLKAGQRVGTVRLGTGDGAVELSIAPKLPIRRLFGLLDDLGVQWQAGEVMAAADDRPVPLLATVFARAAERTLRSGVLHGYVHREDALTVVRGRIRTGAQVSRRMGRPVPIEVAYDDYLADIPENRLLLSAIEVARRLPGVPEVTTTVLRHLSGRLVGVTPIPGGAPLPRWTPSRLNTRYITALKLAELILSGASLRQQGLRAVHMNGFLLNLAQVFEDFLVRRLTIALRPFGLRCTASQESRLTERHGTRIRTDLLVHRAGRPSVVVDAKYRTLKGNPPPEHLYQVIAYCTALDVAEGHLVYASGTPAAEPYRIRNSTIRVHAHVLDLDQEPSDLFRDVDRLAGRLHGSANREKTTT
uniref:McrC family protein n=1 Tax=Herbidospora sakaeratensis TaxID=564415 RepID=UPI000780D801|nr:hypothetical protein [Herbidospora sakaeratensis]